MLYKKKKKIKAHFELKMYHACKSSHTEKNYALFAEQLLLC